MFFAANTSGADVSDDLEVAWEVLETARVVYTKHDTSDEIKLKLADVYSLLGEVNMENGTHRAISLVPIS